MALSPHLFPTQSCNQLDHNDIEKINEKRCLTTGNCQFIGLGLFCGSSKRAILYATLLLSICTPIWSLSDLHRLQRNGGTRIHQQWGSKLTLMAKPAPVDSLDLDAILEFESQLERMAAAPDLEEKEAEGPKEFSSSEVKTYNVPGELHNKRIDAAMVALEPELSRSYCGNLVSEGCVSFTSSKGNDQVIDRKSFKVEAGMTLSIAFPHQEAPTEILAQDIPLDILFEDEHMIVINKAADIVVHPAVGNWDGTIVNALAHYLRFSPHGMGEFLENKAWQRKGNDSNDIATTMNEAHDGSPLMDMDENESTSIAFRPGIVHRLDKGTTGVLVVAKTSMALSKLAQAFAERTVQKTYLAITVGNPGTNVVIDKPIGRHPIHRQRMRVVPEVQRKKNRASSPKMSLAKSPSQAGRRALSRVDTIATNGKLSLARVRIYTGRTHQIRVHLQDRGTPVYGDDVYGLTDWNRRLSTSHKIERPLLHAHRLELNHPITDERMTFEAPLSPDMELVAKTITSSAEALAQAINTPSE